MNERIKELAIQSGVVETHVQWEAAGGDLLEKFAELILKEAISSIDEQISFSDADTAGDIAVQLGMYNAKDIIMKHFGVEE
jgi:hypothetical protein